MDHAMGDIIALTLWATCQLPGNAAGIKPKPLVTAEESPSCHTC
jgi:hypothetical protein